MKFVTVATHNDGYLKWLKESCKRYSANLIILGFGEKWQGYNWKFIKMKEFLEQENPDEIILFLDAYDTLLLNSPEELETTYKQIKNKFGKSIIISEDQPSPLYMKILTKLTFGKCQEKPINSGTYIGTAGDLLIMINQMMIKSKGDPTTDDQVLLREYCEMNSNDIHIDTDNDIFLVKGDPYRLINDDIINTIKNKKVFVGHFPGNTIIDNLIYELGYDMTKEEQDEVKEYHRKALMKKIQYYSNMKVYRIILLIFIWSIVFYLVKTSMKH